MRTLGHRVCSELGAPRRRADTTHLAIVRPGTPIVSRRRARASDFRMPGAPFAWTKAGLEPEIGGLRRLEYPPAPFSPASIAFSVMFLWQREYSNQFCLNQFKKYYLPNA